MAIYGNFASPVHGMLTQAATFGAISQNISNVNTSGYKAIDTRFTTVLANSFDANSDIGGVRGIRRNFISQQGDAVASTNNTDIAISGQGFIVVNTELDGTGDRLYTRDGSLQIKKGPDATVTGIFRADGSFDTSGTTPGTPVTITTQEAHLADKNGHYIQGYVPNEAGVFPTLNGTTVPIRIDQFAFSSNASATSNATVFGNLPSTDAPGTVQTMKAGVFDELGGIKSFEIQWTRASSPQQWALQIAPENGTNTTVPTSETFTFGSDGKLPTGTTHTFTVDWADGQSSSVALDISNVSSSGTTFEYISFDRDGFTAGDLLSFSFDNDGEVRGTFTNGASRALYKIPLATFVNPDSLEPLQGNLFTESPDSGTVNLRPAGVDQFGLFIPFATEQSNTSLQTEFTRMILVQQAYRLSGSVFTTVDEMTKQAVDLKS